METMMLWLSQFHFLRPWWLLALLPVAWLGYKLWTSQRQAGHWRDFIAPHLLDYLLEEGESKSSRAPLIGLLALWIAAVIAAAGPAWQKLPQPVQQGGSALVIAWDMSPSMRAQDLSPSRLTRSRLKLVDLLRARDEGVTGLVAYAGEGHVVTPLTDDTATIISLLPALTPEVMPVSGSNPEMALRMAQRLLNDAGIARGNILFVTDGIAPSARDTLERIAGGSPHQITIWGVGTDQGAPIPLPQGGFARDSGGEMVLAELDENRLQDLAADLNGYYVPMLNNGQDVQTLQRLFQAPGENLRDTDRVFDTWYEHGPWLLILLLPFVALLFRRGWLMALPIVLLPLGAPQEAQALEWQDLWQNQNQQGQAALENDQPEAAAELFKDPDWRGTARYRAGDYQGALEAFRQSEPTADNLYNRGNALLRIGKYQQAIEAYRESLEKAPHDDAQANLALAEQLLKRQQAQNKHQPQQNQNQQGQQQQSGQQPSGSSQQQSQDQQGQKGRKNKGDRSGRPDQPLDDPGNNTASSDQQSAPQKENAESPKPGEAPPKQEKAREQTSGSQAEADGEDQRRQSTTASTRMSESEREQQQALEQWLRKVPDDPSGLIRNKFMHEYRERRRSNNWQPPETDATQRW